MSDKQNVLAPFELMALPFMEPEAIVQTVINAFNSRKLPQGQMSVERLMEHPDVYKLNTPFKEYYTFAIALSAKVDADAAAKYLSLSSQDIAKITASAKSRLATAHPTFTKAYSQIMGYAKAQKVNAPSLTETAIDPQVPTAISAISTAVESPSLANNQDTPLKNESQAPSADVIDIQIDRLIDTAAHPPGMKKVTPEKILQAACRVYSELMNQRFKAEDVINPGRAHDVVHLRHFVFYAQATCLPQKPYSILQLSHVKKNGEGFNHTTLMAGIEKITKLVSDNDEMTLKMIDGLIKDLGLHQRQIDGLKGIEKERFKTWPVDETAPKADKNIEPKTTPKGKGKIGFRSNPLAPATGVSNLGENPPFSPLTFAEIFGEAQSKYREISNLEKLTPSQHKFVSDFAVYATLKVNPESAYTPSQVARNVGELSDYALSAFQEVAISLGKGNHTLQVLVQDIIESFPMSPDQADLLRTPDTSRFKTLDDIKRPIIAFEKAAQRKQNPPISADNYEEGGLDPQDEASQERIMYLDVSQIIDATLQAFREEALFTTKETFFKDGRASEEVAAMRAFSAYVAQRCLPSRDYQLKSIADSLNKTPANAIAGIHRIEDLLSNGDEETKTRLRRIADCLPLTKQQRTHLFLADTERFKEWQDIVSPQTVTVEPSTNPVPSRSPELP